MTELVEILGFKKVPKKLISKYLQADIDDDWFQDPIRYSDFIAQKKEVSIITQNIQENVGRYLARRGEIFYVPKSNFTLRYTLETDYYDRWMYFFLTLPLLQKFDPLLSTRIYSHRYAGGEKYLFHNSIRQWEKFEGVVRSQAGDKIILETDVQNYFENISLEILEADLNNCLRIAESTPDEVAECRKSIDSLMLCLRNWTYDGKRGIPQNRDSSSFLASIYMKEIDELMIGQGFDYYRYMDDIRIVCGTKFEARRAIMLLVNNLRPKHLSLNGKKTKIIEPGTAEHNQIVNPDFTLRGIDALLTTKRKGNVAVGYNLLRDQCIKIIQEGAFDGREFRFCINRLSRLARCNNYAIPLDFWEPIIAGVIQSIIDSPTSSDRAFEFLASVSVPESQMQKIEEYLISDHESIYEWQNYWLWKLMVIWGRGTEPLLRYAKNIATNLSLEPPNVAGAMLFISKFGSTEDKVQIKNMFRRDLPAFLQRHILLSIKDLDWVRDGVESIRDEMPKRLEGAYRHIRENISDVVAPPPTVSINDLIASLHQYD